VDGAERYTPYSALLKAKGFAGLRVRKVTLNGGFTCPNLDGTKARGGCTFCDNRSFSPSAGNRALSIPEQLRIGMEYQRSRFGARRFIPYFQTFSGTYAPVERLRELYAQALDHPDVIGLAIGTRPDCLTREIADLLDEIGGRTFVTLELGLQSSDDATLRRINRAHGFAEFAAAMDLCAGRRFEVCVHVILGLPGEDRSRYRATAQSLSAWEYHSVKIHPLHVVKGTVLERQYLRGEYRPLGMEEYVAGLADFLERVPSGVGVQRFTADARGDLHVAPAWCKRKSDVRAALSRELAARGSWQGWALGDAPPAGLEGAKAHAASTR
jgi:radical SAM protein (TIGR01212 family)